MANRKIFKPRLLDGRGVQAKRVLMAVSLACAAPVLLAQDFLKEAIAQSKMRMATEMTGKSGQENSKSVARESVVPQILYITGIQQELTAGFVFPGELVRVPLKVGSTARNWKISGVSSDGVTLMDRSSGKSVRLQAPGPGASWGPFHPFMSVAAGDPSSVKKEESTSAVHIPMPIRQP